MPVLNGDMGGGAVGIGVGGMVPPKTGGGVGGGATTMRSTQPPQSRWSITDTVHFPTADVGSWKTSV